MLQDQRLAFIGAGNMAEAMIAGLIDSGRQVPAHITASDIRTERLDHLSRTYQIAVSEKNRDAAASADVVVLAVEPQILDEVSAAIAPVVEEAKLVVSVAAGYPIARLRRFLPKASRIVRAMPNTPSAIREGVTALAYLAELSPGDIQLVRALFEPIGKVVEVPERAMDAVTGLSGSGPAYVYLMVEALADGGVKMGLPRETAQLLAAQTVVGAARMILESNEHPGALKDRVASPGGTTIAGLYELERGCLRATLISAVEAATKRSAELGLSV